MAAETDLQFDGWTVNRISGEMSRDGKVTRLAQQPLRILVQLYDHAGEIVTRDQLVKALWPAGVVDFDNGLNVAMRKLRVALDDTGEAPRYIETLPKVGYRFLVRTAVRQVAPASAAPLLPQRPTSPARGIAMLAVAVAAIAAVFWWTSRPSAPPPAPPKHVPSLRAQELYLKALHERSRRDVNPTTDALALLEEALKEDPNYASAWAAYGFTLGGSVMRQMNTPGSTVPRIRAAAERAVALEPDSVEGHVLMVHLLMDHEKNFPAATQALERARATGQLTARFWHYSAMWNAQRGHVEEALADMRRAREQEPMTLLFTSNYALILVNARRYEETIDLLKPIVAANPGFDLARGILARALMMTGDLQGAREQLEARKEIGVLQAELALVYLRLGLRAEAMAELARIEANGQAGFGVAYELAAVYTALGDLDEACRRLEHALTDGSVHLNWMRLDPRMDALRGRQCFADVDRKLYGAEG